MAARGENYSHDLTDRVVRTKMALITAGVSMEKTATPTLAWSLPEQVSFFLKSGMFLFACGAILYVALASEYPAVHDALHNVRHALAVVPCH